MRTHFTRLAVLTAATASLATAATAASPTAFDGPSVTVETADLNLASDAGHTTAMRRIRAAADQVCAAAVDPMSTQRCRSDTIAQATGTLDDRSDRADVVASR